MSKIEVDAITEQSGTTLTTGGGAGKTVVVDATTVTLGRCGGTVALASGASQSGFGRSGSVNWQTTPKTATFTAANGEGYFINSGSAITANLPAGSAGAIVAFSDYARNFETYNFTVAPNGSEKIGGVASPAVLKVNGQAATFVYVDSTKGWVNVQNAEDTKIGGTFIVATGGTITESGDDKIHTFTGPGTFCVSGLSAIAANNQVSYLVVAGGGGGGSGGSPGYGRGGGGAGGFREDKSPVTPYTASPLEGAGAITVTATGFPIVVGGGGAGSNPNSPTLVTGTPGVNSTFSTITSAGGGGGSGNNPPGAQSGGSGGGASDAPFPGVPFSGGAGNTPPVSPPQGNNGGTTGPATPVSAAGGGGGAGAVGNNGGSVTSHFGGTGGAGATTSINGSPTTLSGGGGGGGDAPSGPKCTGGAAGGAGGGGMGGGNYSPGGILATAGTTNTGGGGGGGAWQNMPDTPSQGFAGGSGIVIIRYKFK
jgi:hypothetical protein